MGVVAPLIPYIVAAVGAGVSYHNSQETAHRQDEILAQGIRQREDRQKQIDSRTGKLIKDIGDSNPDQDKQDANSKYLDVLLANKNNTDASVGSVAGASQDYQVGQKAALGDIGKYGTDVAGLMSRIDAPQAQRRRESVMQGDYGVDLDQIKRATDGDSYLNNLKLQSVHRNALEDAFAAAAEAYGASAAGGAGAGAATVAGNGSTYGSGGSGNAFAGYGGGGYGGYQPGRP